MSTNTVAERMFEKITIKVFSKISTIHPRDNLQNYSVKSVEGVSAGIVYT